MWDRGRADHVARVHKYLDGKINSKNVGSMGAMKPSDHMWPSQLLWKVLMSGSRPKALLAECCQDGSF